MCVIVFVKKKIYCNNVHLLIYLTFDKFVCDSPFLNERLLLCTEQSVKSSCQRCQSAYDTSTAIFSKKVV